MCVLWESNPQPFVLLTQCSTTEPQEHNIIPKLILNPQPTTGKRGSRHWQLLSVSNRTCGSFETRPAPLRYERGNRSLDVTEARLLLDKRDLCEQLKCSAVRWHSRLSAPSRLRNTCAQSASDRWKASGSLSRLTGVMEKHLSASRWCACLRFVWCCGTGDTAKAWARNHIFLCVQNRDICCCFQRNMNTYIAHAWGHWCAETSKY